jgi:tight adherence protein C
MTILVAALIFVTVMVLGLTLGLRYWVRPRVVIDRLVDASGPATHARESWQAGLRRFLAGAGSRIGSREKDRERVTRQLARAGLRKPGALNLYNGSRVAGSILLCAVAAGTGLISEAESSTCIMAAMAGAMAGFWMPGEILQLMIRRRKRAIERALPNALDLLNICVESGLGLDQAILYVSRELRRSHRDISEEFAMINFEIRAGKSRPEALRNMADRTGVANVKELIAVLIQADRFGTSVAQTLRAYSRHLRVQARQTAEEKAAQLSVKLVFPIFFFILPSLFTITIGPVVVHIMRDLLPMMNSL